MTTPNAIIKQALGLIGARAPGESVGGDELSDCWEAFLRLIDELSTEANMQRFEGLSSLNVAQGQINYTITHSGSLPVKVKGVSLKDGNTQYPLSPVIPAGYQAINLPNLSGQPVYYLQSGSGTNINVALWPIPDKAYTGTVDLQYGLYFSDVNDDQDLPAGYRAMLEYNLAVALAPMYEREPSANVINSARTSRSKVATLNYQGVHVEPDNVVLAR
jgi:hypothetical protein